MKSRIWWIVGSLVLVGAVTPFLIRVQKVHAAEVAWDDYERTHGLEAAAAPRTATIPESENFAAAPWIAKLYSNPDAAEEVLGLWHWAQDMEMSYGSSSDEFLFIGKPEEAREALESAEDYEADFAAIREAAARPKCQLPETSSDGKEDLVWQGISNAAGALRHRAEAALAAGEIELAITHLETLLRMGRHLRSEHLVLPSVVGMRMERIALEIIEAEQAGDLLPQEAKQRVVTTMRNSRLEDDLPEIFKHARTEAIESMDSLGKVEGPEGRGTFWHPAARIIALNKLYACQKLEPFLSRKPSREEWLQFETDLYSDPMTLNRLEGGLGLGLLRVTATIIPDFIQHEEEFERVRNELSK